MKAAKYMIKINVVGLQTSKNNISTNALRLFIIQLHQFDESPLHEDVFSHFRS